MPKPEITKSYIASNFQQLVEQYGHSKITVLDIVDKCDINRKTFYYHFENKDDLIAWKFRYELGCLLKQEFDAEYLVYTDDGYEDKYANLPYYVRLVNSDGMIEGGMFFELLADYLESHRNYYHIILRGDNGAALRTYLLNLYGYALKQDALLFLGVKNAVDIPIDMLSRYFASASIGWLLNLIMYENYSLSHLFVNECGNITHEAMAGFIKAHPNWFANME